MSVNVDYYEKIRDLQAAQHESEQKRLQLEQQLNVQLHSDQRLAKLRAVRLQNYWKKLCEDEKRSKERNDQLLREFDRVEAQLSAMAAKTEKLRKMKKEYEDHIEMNYPNWKERVLEQQRLRQAQQTAEETQRQMQYQAMAAPVQIQHTPATPQSAASSDNFHSNIPATAAAQPVYNHPTAQSQPQLYATPGSARSHSSARQQSEGGYAQPQQYQQQPTSAGRTVSARSVEERVERSRSHHSQNVIHRVTSPQRDADNTIADESFSDDDRPLTPQDLEPPISVNKSPVPTPRSSFSQGSAAAPAAPATQVQDVRKNIPQADVSISGFFKMLDAVEGDLSNTDSAAFIYRSDPPAATVCRDVIQNANAGRGLQHVNGETVSMVVLDQLPLIVANTPAACLLPDSMLYRPPATLTQTSIKTHIAADSHTLFDRLYEHFVQLLKYKTLSAEAIAATFAPLIIDSESPYEEKAKQAVDTLLESVDPGDLVLTPASTSTFSTIPSPRKSMTSPISTKVPPLNLQMSVEESEPESEDEVKTEAQTQSLAEPEPESKPEMIHESGPESEPESEPEPVKPQPSFISPPQSVDLTQSAAYRQLLGGTGASMGTVVASDDDSDDIENQFGSMVSPGARKNSGVLSPTSPPQTSPPPTTGASAVIESDSDDDTPSFSDMGKPSGGYVPTAVGQSAKSTMKSTLGSSMGSTGKSAKKPAFYGDSDTDEDVDVPGAGNTGNSSKHGQEEDDFDFYG